MTTSPQGQLLSTCFTPYEPSRAETVLADMADAFIALDADWRLTYFDRKAETLFQRTASAVLGHVIFDVIPEVNGSGLHRACEAALRTCSAKRMEAYAPRLDRWFIAGAYPTEAGGVAVYARDVTQQKRTDMALRESEERFRAVFEQAPVGIGLLDFSGRWVRVNPRLCEILGYTTEELLGLRFQDVTFPKDLQWDLDQMKQTLRTRAAGYQLEKRFVRKSGVPVWCRLTMALVRGPDETPKYFIKIIEDISARKQFEAMLGGAAHELRSPVTHIKGFISTLRNAELPTETQQDFMAGVESETDRLAQLIEDLLEHTGAGGVERDRRVRVRPDVLVARVVERVRQDLAKRVVEIDVPHDLPAIEVDMQSMQRVFINLLQNANKYTPETSPIHISADFDGSSGKVAIHVDDHGPGVAVDERESIFQPFYRTGSARSSASGKGLGLAICRTIVEAHGGDIVVVDAPGGGARFTVSLPLKVPSRGTEPAPHGPDQQHCAYCGASRPRRVARVFTPEDPYGSWRLCSQCWRFLEIGFKAQCPAENLHERLDAIFPPNGAEVHGWISAGLKHAGRKSATHR